MATWCATNRSLAVGDSLLTSMFCFTCSTRNAAASRRAELRDCLPLSEAHLSQSFGAVAWSFGDLSEFMKSWHLRCSVHQYYIDKLYWACTSLNKVSGTGLGPGDIPVSELNTLLPWWLLGSRGRPSKQVILLGKASVHVTLVCDSPETSCSCTCAC